MRGICGNNGQLYQNCAYNGPPLPVPYGDDYYYRELCPQLFLDGNIAVCCDAEQFDILRLKMTIPQQLLSQCPSCYSNFLNFWCQFTCSPMQYNFVNIIKMNNDSNMRNNQTYVSHVEYFVNESYIIELFDSCKNVRTANGDYVMSMMCGTNIENCTPKKLFKFLGTFNKALNIPFTIDVIFNNEIKQINKKIIYPMNATAFKCNSSSDISDLSCSCSDCASACTSLPFPNILEESCKIAMMDCSTAMFVIAISALFCTLMITIVLHYMLKRFTAENFIENEFNFNLNYPTTTTAKCKNEIKCQKLKIEDKLVYLCENYGRFVAKNYRFVFFIGLIPAIFASFSAFQMRLTTDPVELWSSPESKARKYRDYFNKFLTPFYRTEQLIIVPRNQSNFMREDPQDFLKTIEFGPVFRKEFLIESFKLYSNILKLNASTKTDKNITLNSICFKPLLPENNNCAIYSIFNYFQNNISNLYLTNDDSFNNYDYIDHILDCIKNPYTMHSKIKMKCLGDFGGPITPYIILGDFNSLNTTINSEIDKYRFAHGLVIIFLVNNNLTKIENERALAWEASFIKYMKSVQNPLFTISFMVERSLQDEIERQSSSDILTVIISYLFMFIYVTLALGQYQVNDNNLCSLFISTKFIVGISGILSVILSVTSSIGLFALYNLPASLLILEVEPFLILAVGVDNIFIFVQTYQHLSEEHDRSLSEQMALICSEVMPSMILSSLSECLCFCFGSLSDMPAVQTFSLYAALAIFLNFFLQITIFLSVFVWDIRRQKAGRLEMFCCIKMKIDVTSQDSFMYKLFKLYYAPFLLRIRSFVIIIFVLWFASSVLVVNKIKTGLDQKLAVPEDSYVLTHFINMDRFLSVGPVVYFVLKGDFNYENEIQQNLICSSVGCSPNSLGSQIARAAKYPKRSYIALPATNWVDEYMQWLKPLGIIPCCRQFNENGTFCSPNIKSNNLCKSCNISFDNGRPLSTQFYYFLNDFLNENPSINCVKAGHAAYGSAIQYNKTLKKITTSHFMTYHSVLKTSEDYIKAMESATFIAKNITRNINNILKTLNKPLIEIFVYSPYYVFYEQYLNIVHSSIIQILFSLASIFCVTTVLLGMDPWSAFIIVIVIGMILINLIGLMYWWSIDFNAISVVNLVMSIGISVEFCAHIVSAFSNSIKHNRVDRTIEALSKVGSSVLSGITLTKLGGIIVLAFAHSKIFNVYYFRMFFGIVIIGATHGLIFLPVFLSICGPPINRHRLMLKKFLVNNKTSMTGWLKSKKSNSVLINEN